MSRHHVYFLGRFTALAATAVLVSTLATPSAGAAATAGPGTTAQSPSRVSVSPHTVEPAGRIIISGSIPVRSCPASDDAVPTSTAALFPPDGFGPAAPRTRSGHFRVPYTVPASTPPGTYQIGLRCGGGQVGVSATLRVG